ncbi:MAG TPA: type I-D CRISPR-associated protein Cas7/Csc2 [Firmicutes bacterium]|nr:type I-D CRISPR-associated protein Cas7/Csc2 [Bacillota bacterium]
MSEKKNLDCGLISPNAKTVIVSAVLETVGQVRFGDGTEVNLTITEKDLVPTQSGGFVEKVVFSGSKRRGVDRRTVHTLRNQFLALNPFCYIPELCRRCPTCWLFGGTAMGEGYNIKSRVLYASALSVEPADIAVAVHNRNAPNELDHTTGEAGIHSEELIKANVHFPTITVLDRVVDWEIGAFAHALLENVNGNRYTAASARQGGIRFSEGDGGKLIVVDVSEQGIFPLETVKVPGEETDFARVKAMFVDAANLEKIKAAFHGQGFTCDTGSGGSSFTVKSGARTLWTIEKADNVITVKQGQGEQAKVLMTRFVGERAYGFLRERQEDCKHFFDEFTPTEWEKTLAEIKRRLKLETDTALPEEVARLVESGAQKEQVVEALKKHKLSPKEEGSVLIVTKGKKELTRLTVEPDGTVKRQEAAPSDTPSEEDAEE